MLEQRGDDAVGADAQNAPAAVGAAPRRRKNAPA
jgi:hypothetical protein